MDTYTDSEILWSPSKERVETSQMYRFARLASSRSGHDLTAYPQLYEWSCKEPEAFWSLLAEFFALPWHQTPSLTRQQDPEGRMRFTRWFPGGMLNYAEALLRSGVDQDVAMTSFAESASRRVWTRGELRRDVALCASALKQLGVNPGDRVAGVLINGPEAVIAMLAVAALGAVWSSSSPDFGEEAIIDRFGQIEPVVLFASRSYVYAKKRFDCEAKIGACAKRLPSVKKVVYVDHFDENDEFFPWIRSSANKATDSLRFEPRSFSDPLFIMFSSGTTGVPKCIVHSVGGTLLQHLKELSLHSDIGPTSKLFYYTTTGWMMWNWMVSALATGAAIVTYDGAVSEPDFKALWRIVAAEKVTAFGTSPRFIAASMAQEVDLEDLDLKTLKTVLSTGSPLAPEQFRWVYTKVKDDVHLASISGGTDIIGCFMLGVPILPVRAGEIQYAGLGMDIHAFDESGKSVHGTKGELVCTQPFVSMPTGFWNDKDGEKYRRAYFDHYSGDGCDVWRHGDYIEITPAGGIIVYGRSDATLNPGGVRIGTAELYRQVEQIPEVLDSLAIGMRKGDDTEIVLFVKVRPEADMTTLTAQLKNTIRSRLTPRHVPKEVVRVSDIPYTRSGKKVEIAATEAVHGEEVRNVAALQNPESLGEYRDWGKLYRRST